MTNREWLSTLPDEKFYDELKRVEQTEGRWSTDTRMYMIDWLDAKHAGKSKPPQDKKMQAITEEMNLHEEWFKQAREIQTADELATFVDHMLNGYYHDYGTVCHAIAACTLASAWLGAHTEGITHFQAGFVMWDFIHQWMKPNNKCGLKLIDYDHMLYPQYQYEYEKTISKDVFESLQKEAKRLLDTKRTDIPASPAVLDHWQSIVNGKVPFGYTIAEEEL